MTYRTLLQFVVLILIGVVAVTYIQPTFIEMQSIEAETAKYREAVDKASQFNALLNSLLNEANSLSQTELQLLERYIPVDFDGIAVAKDIETLSFRNGLTPLTISLGESRSLSTETIQVVGIDENGDPIEIVPDPRETLTANDFSVALIGTYTQFKNFLSEMEVNAYPLRPTSISVSVPESEDFNNPVVPDTFVNYTFTMTLETYSLDL